MKKIIGCTIPIVLIIVLLSSWLRPSSLAAQSGDDRVQQIMDQMSAADKVGQLFLVTFSGTDTGPASDIATLIGQYRVGGVVLSAGNGNFVNSDDTPRQVAQLSGSLQALAFAAADQAGDGTPFVPLFVAVEQEGDGYPHTEIRGGLTPLPSNMALGATWKQANAQAVGQIAGRELRAMGINMLFGPSMDVLDNPRPGLAGDLSTRVFGGDPFWVGSLGRAYIRGIHEGSEGQVVTVAKHFPGAGGSDRRIDEEVAAVPKTVQDLQKTELPPFLAVTRSDSDDPQAVTDALMTSHVRYRQLTRPISFDAQALQTLLSLPGLAAWREDGGLLVTSGLGVPAVRKYYDPQLQTFPFKRIAQEALVAGNDVLVLSQFALTDDWPAQFENIKATIEFFRDKYASDPSFQARVDEAVQRILRLKLRVYPQFDLETSVADVEKVGEIVGQGQGQVTQVAQDAVTLIYPAPGELAERLPNPPLIDEDILIFTDDRPAQDCDGCSPFPYIASDALQQTILRLYGPEGSGQVDPQRIHSLTFSQLKAALQPQEGLPPPEANVDALVEEADWILFAMLNINTDDYPESDAVKAFLKLRSDSLRDKKLVVMAYSAPYYLDTTEITKLTAYYGIYSKIGASIEASIRALFREFAPSGAPPVSVRGINYDLASQVQPDPAQIIAVGLADVPVEEGTPAPVEIDVGGSLRLRAGPVVDGNGHPVPDGTTVVFRLFYPADSLELPRIEARTVAGLAETTITVERTGRLEITAYSDPAFKSTTLAVTIQGGEPATIETVVPTPTPTHTVTPTPTPTSTPTPMPTETPSPTPTPTPVPPPPPPERRVGLGDFLLSLTGVMLVGGMGYTVLRRDEYRVLSRRLNAFLWATIGGMGGYILYALGMPGADRLRSVLHWAAAPLFCMVFSLLALSLAPRRKGGER